MKPEIKLLREWFSYNPETGRITRKQTLRWDLDELVPLDKRLYFLGKRYPYSHIVWAIHYGKWPENMIDHKNHDQLDFRLDNLREAIQNQNQHNKRGSGRYSKGVYYDSSVERVKPWLSRIMVNHKSIFLGSFETEEEAAKAYQEACIKYHGEFACPQ